MSEFTPGDYTTEGGYAAKVFMVDGRPIGVVRHDDGNWWPVEWNNDGKATRPWPVAGFNLQPPKESGLVYVYRAESGNILCETYKGFNCEHIATIRWTEGEFDE